MPSKVLLIFIAFALIIGLFLVFKPRSPALINEDTFVADKPEEVEYPMKSKYNLYNEIRSFMARQTEYVMS